MIIGLVEIPSRLIEFCVQSDWFFFFTGAGVTLKVLKKVRKYFFIEYISLELRNSNSCSAKPRFLQIYNIDIVKTIFRIGFWIPIITLHLMNSITGTELPFEHSEVGWKVAQRTHLGRWEQYPFERPYSWWLEYWIISWHLWDFSTLIMVWSSEKNFKISLFIWARYRSTKKIRRRLLVDLCWTSVNWRTP